MGLPFKLIVILNVALVFLGDTAADDELEFAASDTSADSSTYQGSGTAGEAAPEKRNLAALARNGRLPRFHYHKKLSPGGRGGMTTREGAWVGDHAFQADAAEKMGVVEALGRLSEAAIFPYIGPHRFSFLHSMRMRRDVTPYEDSFSDVNMDKRNVAALARNGWLPAGASRGPRSRTPPQNYIPTAVADDVDLSTSDEDDSRDCVENIILVPEEIKRNLPHLAKSGRLPPFSYRRLWGSNGAGGGPPLDVWSESRPKRGFRRCRTSSGDVAASKRNLPFMARKGMLPRS